MQKIQIRTRAGSISDMHILHCDCSHCDGVGELNDYTSHGVTTRSTSECPACEGMGYLEPASREAYEAYLADLYRDVVRTMPNARTTLQRYPKQGQIVNTAA